eukprot:189593_1
MILYKDLVIKINEYLATEVAKKMVAKQANGRGIKLEYEVEEDTKLQFHHLLALLLYTDYSKLCTEFSSSFRALTVYEPLSSIKKRNSSYWWMSKNLREAVQLFGYKKTNVY